MTNKQKFEKAKEQMEELRKQIKETAKGVFKDMSKELFDAHPDLVSFSWRQYTPYFNDGEECVFSAHTDDMGFKFTDTEENEDDYDFDYYNGEDISSYTVDTAKGAERTPKIKAAAAVYNFIDIFDEDDLKEMFGDHIRVTVTRDGVDIDEYGHD